jgi:hypothetical protein
MARLRGLSRRPSVLHVLESWLASGILVPKDLPFGREDSRDAMTMAVLSALTHSGACVTLDAQHSIEHLSSQEVALLFFEAITADVGTLDSLRGVVAEWCTAFPANHPWVPLLLAGMIVDERYVRRSGVSDREKCIWLMLWEWRTESVASDWLQASDNCRSWGRRSPFDLLTSIRKTMANESPDSLGLSAAQHKDLLVWCDRLLAEREALKAGITGASAG